MLREKDLAEPEYAILAAEVARCCAEAATPCILHTYVQTAIALNIPAIHLPLQRFLCMTPEEKQHFTQIGVSCHSVSEAVTAQAHGCTYLTAGHIFPTACKQGIPGRGLSFLSEIVQAVQIPVYAIGGIRAENIELVRQAGAAGACVMSDVMTCEKTDDYLHRLERSKT